MTLLLLNVALLGLWSSAGDAYPRPGRTELASRTSDGRPGGGQVARISSTGRFVVFVSDDPTHVIPDLNPGRDVFIHDRKKEVTELVSVSSEGEQGIAVEDCEEVMPAVTPDGRFIAFQSNAPNLTPDDRNQAPDVFVHDRRTRRTDLVSVSSNNRQQNASACWESSLEVGSLALSEDGRYVAWVSRASNLIKDDTNGLADVFVHDRKTGRTERASVASDGSEGTDFSSCPAISPTGRFVAFWSSAPNLHERDTNEAGDVFLRDMKRKRTEMVSLRSDGVANSTFGGGGLECGPGEHTVAISRTGRYIAFSGLGSELVPYDEPPLGGMLDADVFVRDRKAGRTERVSVTSDGEEAMGGFAIATAVSADGRFVTFTSSAKNLFPDDDEEVIPIAFGDEDVFVHDRVAGSTNMVSLARDGGDGACCPTGGWRP